MRKTYLPDGTPINLNAIARQHNFSREMFRTAFHRYNKDLHKAIEYCKENHSNTKWRERKNDGIPDPVNLQKLKPGFYVLCRSPERSA